MKHQCDGMTVFLESASKKDSISIKKAPDGDGYLLVVLFKKQMLGWGMRFYYCPFCGEKL